MSNDLKKHEYLKTMTPEQKEKAIELYDAISAFAEPDFENMSREQVNQYLRDHGYDPEQVELRGKILVEALIENLSLKTRAEAAEAKVERFSLVIKNILSIAKARMFLNPKSRANFRAFSGIANMCEVVLKGGGEG